MKTELGHPASDSGSTAEELLAAARFGTPELRASHVHRPRLLQTMAGADDLSLVLVSGPAGSGKTSVVTEWVRNADETSATGWITFEDGDRAFWGFLLECLGRLGLEVPAGAGDNAADALLGADRLTRLAEAIADRAERWTVVLDGYEMVSLDLAREVDLLLRHTFGRLRLVFVGRVDPVLPLYRYRLADRMLEVRADELAFTDDEAAELLERLGVRLGSAFVHDLNTRVKGWVAGLRFAARALAGRDDPESSVATVVAQTGDINEYLLGEVLDIQSPEVRAFLLDTSLPDVLCPGLVEELGGVKALHMLDELSRANAFIEHVPDRSGSFRYYAFFRDLLRAQLAYEAPERMDELHRLAARWFQREGLPDQAIGHLAAVSAWEELSALVVEGLLVGRLVLEGPDGVLAQVGRALPGELDDAAVCVVRAAVALAEGDRGASAEEISRARRTADEASAGAVHLSISVLDAVRGSYLDAADQAAHLVDEARRELSRLQSRPRTRPESELYALVQLSTGVAMLRQGDLRRARKALTIAVGLEPSRRYPSLRADCLGYLALIDAQEGSLSRATRTAEESITTAAEAGISPARRTPAAQVALGFVALERYELKAARDHVTSALAAGTLLTDPICRNLVEGVVAGLERASGRLQPALARLDVAAAGAAATDPWLADRLRLEAARLSVASGRTELALGELDKLREPDQPGVQVVAAAAYAEQGQEAAAADSLARARAGQPRLDAQVAGLLVEFVGESRRRSPARAHVPLDRSLRLAAPELLRRPFHEAGPAVQRQLTADPRLLVEHPWLNHSGDQSPGGRAAGFRGEPARGGVGGDPKVVEALTTKELEVLGHLEELLTTEEIAEKMFVSVNTVRTHVRSILRKLGVSRRNAAVRKARDLGLFGG